MGGGSVRLAWLVESWKAHYPAGSLHLGTGTVGHLLLGTASCASEALLGHSVSGTIRPTGASHTGFWESVCWEVPRPSAQAGLAPGYQRLAAQTGPRSSESRHPEDTVPVPIQEVFCLVYPVRVLMLETHRFSVLPPSPCTEERTEAQGQKWLGKENSVVRIHLAIIFFMLLVFEVHWTSWICGLVVFIKFRNFLAIISPNIFFFWLPILLQVSHWHLHLNT